MGRWMGRWSGDGPVWMRTLEIGMSLAEYCGNWELPRFYTSAWIPHPPENGCPLRN